MSLQAWLLCNCCTAAAAGKGLSTSARLVHPMRLLQLCSSQEQLQQQRVHLQHRTAPLKLLSPCAPGRSPQPSSHLPSARCCSCLHLCIDSGDTCRRMLIEYASPAWRLSDISI